MGPEFDASYMGLAPALLTVVEAASVRVTEGAAGYIPGVLEETGQARYLAPSGEVVPSALVGYDGSGRSIDGLYANAPFVAKRAVAAGATSSQALTVTGKWLVTATATLLADVARAVETVQMGNHRVGGYVRALSLPSCSRCAVLAGAWYADSVAFQRHPKCDCRHVPASKAFADEFVLDSREYFDSLPREEQDRIFTGAGAEAIREGADINQVVNARRGMYRAQEGRLMTREGTTRRGLAGSRGIRARAMPETLRAQAGSKAEFIDLLRTNGYIR
jgi:hypothetical protein